MSDVKTFELEGVAIDVKDSTARSDAAGAVLAVQNLGNRVTALENLSRLSVSYNANTETISFTTT